MTTCQASYFIAYFGNILQIRMQKYSAYNTTLILSLPAEARRRSL